MAENPTSEALVALEQAAMSLRAIANLAGRDECMEDMTDVRAYANSRAIVAEAALAASKAEADGGEAVDEAAEDAAAIDKAWDRFNAALSAPAEKLAWVGAAGCKPAAGAVPEGYIQVAIPVLRELIGDERLAQIEAACTFPLAAATQEVR